MRTKGVLLAAAAASWGMAAPAWGQSASAQGTLAPIATSSEALTAAEVWAQQFASLRASLSAAERRIDELERQLRGAQAQLAVLEEASQPPSVLAGLRGLGAAPMQLASAAPASRPVGEAPATVENTQQVVAALPEDVGVLTRKGGFVFEPTLNYTNSASNRLVFRGVEIVTGVQVGVLEADTTARDTVVATGALRYGLTGRSEIELRVPYIYRNDRITTVAQATTGTAQTMRLDANGIGDVELTGRYQLTGGGPDKPILVANLRMKSDTGSSPYEVARDEAGVASELAVGSGFWAVEPSLSALIVTDPAVIFANLSYLHSFKRRVDQQLGTTTIGLVKPGDSLGASLGFGFSLNPRFSFSLGYRHNYIFPTRTELNGVFQKSEPIHIGSMLFGLSYRVTEARSINTQFEFGVTADAPSMSVTVRTPFSS
jgi:hypothetical protein